LLAHLFSFGGSNERRRADGHAPLIKRPALRILIGVFEHDLDGCGD